MQGFGERDGSAGGSSQIWARATGSMSSVQAMRKQS
jgi:hypothetical protein